MPGPARLGAKLLRLGTGAPGLPDYAGGLKSCGPAAVKLGQALATRPDLVGTLGHAEGIGDVGFGGAEPNVGSQATNIISLGGFAIEPAYQVSFSQHYRQQLLACF